MGSIRPGTRCWAPHPIATCQAGAQGAGEGRGGLIRVGSAALTCTTPGSSEALGKPWGSSGDWDIGRAEPNRGSQPASSPAPEDPAETAPGLGTQGPLQWDNSNASALNPALVVGEGGKGATGYGTY